MKVHIYHLERDGSLAYEGSCDLAECFPGEPDECADAASRLKRGGYHWTGGGASPAFLISPTPVRTKIQWSRP